MKQLKENYEVILAKKDGQEELHKVCKQLRHARSSVAMFSKKQDWHKTVGINSVSIRKKTYLVEELGDEVIETLEL